MPPREPRDAPGAWEHTATDGHATGPPERLDGFPVRDPGRYEIHGEFARGGLGRILRAFDRQLQRTVAIKELLRANRAAEARFVREATITAHLSHPAIVPIYEAGRWPTGELFYEMKLVSGRSLKELIQTASTPETRIALLPKILTVTEAIAHAHAQGIVHRDLKPSNILVGEFGDVVVIDWGLAKDLEAEELPTERPDTNAYRAPGRSTDVTVAGSVLGTPAYMAPEQARGDEVDEGADVYAVGAILYHCLSGAPPHTGATPAEILASAATGHHRALEELAPHLPADLVAIVETAMAVDVHAG